MKNSELVELIYAAIPYSNQICKLDLETEQNAIRFQWRGVNFRVGGNAMVEEVGDGVLIGSNIALLLQQLLKAYLHRNSE